MALVAHFKISEKGSGMTPEQYETILAKLEAAGAGAPPGRLRHVAYENGDGSLNVIDVYDTPENFEAFGAVLMPILAEVGVDPGEPVVSPVHNTIDG
jgi:hypothetical protein